MRSVLLKLAHLSPHPLLFIPLHSVLITTLNQSLSLPSPYYAFLYPSLNKNSDLHIRVNNGIINFGAFSCQMTAVDTLAFLATYNYEESIFITELLNPCLCPPISCPRYRCPASG